MTKQECIDSGCKGYDKCQGILDCKNDEDIYFCADCNSEITAYQYISTGLCFACSCERRLKA